MVFSSLLFVLSTGRRWPDSRNDTNKWGGPGSRDEPHWWVNIPSAGRQGRGEEEGEEVCADCSLWPIHCVIHGLEDLRTSEGRLCWPRTLHALHDSTWLWQHHHRWVSPVSVTTGGCHQWVSPQLGVTSEWVGVCVGVWVCGGVCITSVSHHLWVIYGCHHMWVTVKHMCH